MVTELVSAHSPLCCALVALNLPDDKLTVNFHAASVVTHETGLNTEGLETDSEQGNTEKLPYFKLLRSETSCNCLLLVRVDLFLPQTE